MYTPTHIQVTVQRAKGLLTKGKNGTNNCFVTISLGKEKYQTSLKDNATENVDWHEECELAIPDKGNRAELVLTCLHRNAFGIDEFLGQASLPLNEMDQYERPRSRWHKLQSKPGKEKKKERGDLEVRIAFTVKAGSLSDLSKKDKNKSSLSNIAANVGGSLLSLGTLEKRKGLKKFAKSLGSKVHMSGKKKKEKNPEIDSDSFSGSFSSVGTPGLREKKTFGNPNADPGVISEDEDEFVFDNLSHKSSGSSLNIRSKNLHVIAQNQNDDKPPPLPPTKPPRNPETPTKMDEWETKLYGKHLDIGSSDSLKRRSWENSRVPFMVQEESAKEREREPTIEESEHSMEQISLSEDVTAPASPNISDKPGKQEREKVKSFIEHEREKSEDLLKPKPMPRVNTATELQNLSRNDNEKVKPISPISLKSEKPEKVEKPEQKTKDNIFSKKFKFNRKESPHKQDMNEQVRAINHYNKTNGSSNHSNGERIIIGDENQYNSSISAPKVEISKEILQKYDGKSREEVIKIAHSLENEVCTQKQKIKELEEYLDVLLLKVMETHPRILQNPYSRNPINQSLMKALKQRCPNESFSADE